MSTYSNPSNEPFLCDLASMSVDQMLNHDGDIVANVLKELLPTDEELRIALRTFWQDLEWYGYASDPLTLIRGRHWIKAAHTFTNTYPHHEYARTALAAREELLGLIP